MALKIDIEVDLIVRKVVEALLNSSNEDGRCSIDSHRSVTRRAYQGSGTLLMQPLES